MLAHEQLIASSSVLPPERASEALALTDRVKEGLDFVPALGVLHHTLVQAHVVLPGHRLDQQVAVVQFLKVHVVEGGC